MAEKTRRIIEIDVTTSPGAQKGIRDINNQLRKMEGGAKKSQREVARMSRSFNLFSIAAKAWIALRIARAVTETSDAMVLLGARLNIVTEDTVGVDQAFRDLFEVANLTRQSIESTGTLYARLGFATKALNLEHQDLLTIVQGVNNTLLLSGASAQESASSIIQLSQAFSKGSLDGDEFRSVSEGNVILFGIMQEVLGKTAGELRQFSRDGKLSGEVLARVLTSEQVQSLQSRVDTIPFTFQQAFTLIGNELSSLAHDFEAEFSAITEATVQGIRDIGVFLNFVKAVNDGRVQGFTLSDVIDLDIDDMQKELDKVKPATDAMFHDAKIGAQGYRDEIARLNEEWQKSFDIVAKLSKQTTGTEGAYNKLFQPAFYDKQKTALTEQIALQNAHGHAVALNEKAIADLNIAYVENQEILKRAKEAGQSDPETPAEIALEKYRQTIIKTNFASELLLDQFALLNEMYQSGAINADVYANETDKVERALLGSTEAAKEAQKNFDSLGVAIGNTLAKGVDEVGDALFDLALGLDTSFRQTIENVIEDIGRLIVKITLLNALKAGLSGTGFGDFLFPAAPVASANGNVFNNGSLIPFASGGVVDGPTIFPIGTNTGIMGEAGPEAILPLARGADGKLGVSVDGSGGPKSVHVNIENNGGASQIVSSSSTTDIDGTVINIVLEDIRRGGPLRDSLKGLGEF